MLMVRTPFYIDHLSMQYSKELNARAKASASNKEHFHSIYSQIHPELDEAAIEGGRNSILNGEISFELNNDYTLVTMVILGSEIASLLQKMKWVLIETNSEIPFITSDNFMHVSNLILKTGFYLGLGMPDVCVHMPISKNLSLLMVNRDNFNENVVYDINNPPSLSGKKINLKELIKSYNKKIFCGCKKYVFANSDSQELKNCFNNLLNKAKFIEENLQKKKD
jgi:hypothetical protein